MRTVDRARGRWREILPSLGIAPRFLSNRHGPCPLCGGKDRFRFDDREGTGSFYCNQCGPGQGLLLLQKLHSWDYATAAREVDKLIGTEAPRPRPPSPPASDRNHRQPSFEELLAEANASAIVERYLRGRGLSTVPTVLRGHRSIAYLEDGIFRGRHPAMLAPVVAPNGELRSVHRTYLADVPAKKKLLTSIEKGSAIRLFEPTETLGIAEGIETAIAAHELFDLPTWATINTSIMESFIPPAGLRSLTIFADHDGCFAGQKAAFTLAHNLARERRDLAVEVEIPPVIDSDWLDVLLARRSAA